jgi:hypothetical protein
VSKRRRRAQEEMSDQAIITAAVDAEHDLTVPPVKSVAMQTGRV